jgi:hypothetical protein
MFMEIRAGSRSISSRIPGDPTADAPGISPRPGPPQPQRPDAEKHADGVTGQAGKPPGQTSRNQPMQRRPVLNRVLQEWGPQSSRDRGIVRSGTE